MSTGKSSKPSHHKPYKGPWPEDKHPSIPGRLVPSGGGHDHTVQPHGAPQTPIHKIPPQTPK